MIHCDEKADDFGLLHVFIVWSESHTSLSSVSIASIRPARILYLASMVEGLEACILLLLLWLAQGDNMVSYLDDDRYNEQSELES